LSELQTPELSRALVIFVANGDFVTINILLSTLVRWRSTCLANVSLRVLTAQVWLLPPHQLQILS